MQLLKLLELSSNNKDLRENVHLMERVDPLNKTLKK